MAQGISYDPDDDNVFAGLTCGVNGEGIDEMGLDSRGRWYRWPKKQTIDDLLCLDIAKVAKQIDLDTDGRHGEKWPWSSWGGDRSASIGFDALHGRGLRLRYANGGKTVDPYPIRIVYAVPNYGGKRPWFACPGRNFGRRVRKLHGGNHFLCRHCHDLTYEVCQKSHKKAYQTTIANRMTAIQWRLGTKGGLMDRVPQRPRYMHVCANYALTDEYLELQLLQIYGLVESVRGLVDNDVSPDLPGDLHGRDIWANVKHRRGDKSYIWEKVAASLSDRAYVAPWNGDDWEDIRFWTCRRWKEGHEDVRRWPAGYRLSW